MRWVPYVALLVGCHDATDPEPGAPPAPASAAISASAAEAPPSLSGLPFDKRVFAELKPKLADLTPADACSETCRVALVCRPSEASEADELSKRIVACREDCKSPDEQDAWKPRVAQAKVCLSGPDCDAFGLCMRGSGLAPSATP